MLDSKTETIIKNALRHLTKNRTTITVAHRLSTIVNADKIIVLDRGELIEAGSHQELLQSKGKYSNYYHEQFQSGA